MWAMNAVALLTRPRAASPAKTSFGATLAFSLRFLVRVGTVDTVDAQRL